MWVVEAHASVVDLDFVVGPDTGLEIHIGLIFLGGLLAGAGVIEVGEGAVLGGMIAADLVVGAAVGGAEVEVLVASVGLDAGRQSR
ncbi:MAG: hypothetical protein WDO73_11630 [Ignavibacteriota bacterium]